MCFVLLVLATVYFVLLILRVVHILFTQVTLESVTNCHKGTSTPQNSENICDKNYDFCKFTEEVH
jgi:hypothetical protein